MNTWSKWVAWNTAAVVACTCALSLGGCFGGSSPPTGTGRDASFDVPNVPALDAAPQPAAEAGEAEATSEPTPDASDGGPSTVTIGGSVTGLAGTGLVLANGTDALHVSADGPFTFAKAVAAGSAYSVSVTAQPVDPWQTCTVAGASGTATSDVTTVAVTCTTNTYAVGGIVAGLSATSNAGLVLASALPGGGADVVAVNQNGTFTFPQKLPSGAPYSVTVKSDPTSPAQQCAVSGGTGTVGHADVTSVVVNCATNAFTVGGTVTGLSGTGLVLANGADTVTISADGSFAFPTPVPSGGAYAVSVLAQPTGPTQSCGVANGSGTVGAANVTTVAVSCTTSTFSVGGSASNLLGAGLVLLDNGGDALAVTGSSYTFATKLASGSPYGVTVQTQPTNPWQTCTPAATASGVVGGTDVTNANVACTTNTYGVGGTVTGLTGTGLTLALAGGQTTSVSGASFTFAGVQLASGTPYAVTVQSQPVSPSQTCVVANGTGVVAGADVSVQITCSSDTFSVGGTIAGLSGSGLVLTDEGGDAETIAAGATSFAFATPVPSGAAFDVEVQKNPSGPTQTCTVSGNKGTVGNGPITSVVVNCSTNKFTVGGTVSGLAGTGLILSNGTDTVSVSANGTFAFPTPVASGGSYSVAVKTQPAGPTQSCTVTNGSGSVGSANVTTVAVACGTTKFTVGGSATNLLGTGLVLLDDGGDALTVPAPGTSYTFATPVASGAAYAVTVKTQPTNPWQTCTPAATASGTVGAGNVTNANVTCKTNPYSVGGTVSGLTGSGLTLTLNGGGPLAVIGSSFTFPTQLDSGTQYTVAVQGQPISPSETCSVTGGGTGTIGGANVTGVQIACTPVPFTVGGTITGLSGSGLVLTDDGGDAITIAPGATSFTFPTKVASGASYDVEVQTNPAGPTQSCTASGNKGQVGNGAVTTVSINCATKSYPVGGSISGLAGQGLQLSDGSTTLTPSGNGTFAFPALPSGTAYSVTVTAQPTSPWQTCTVTNGSGTVGSGPVSNVSISCTTNQYALDVFIQANWANPGLAVNDTISGLTFPIDNFSSTQGPVGEQLMEVLASGTSYNLTLTQPVANVTCTLTAQGAPNGLQGTITNGAAWVTVTCPTLYPMNLSFTWEQNDPCSAPVTFYDGYEVITINPTSGNGTYTFSDYRASGQGYLIGFTTTDASCRCVAPSGAILTQSGNIKGGTMSSSALNVPVSCYEYIGVGG